MTRPEQTSTSHSPLPRSHDLRMGRLRVRFNWFIALCLVMTFGMFINLGLWQLDRAADKRQHEAARDRMLSAEPVPFATLDIPEGNHEAMRLQDARPVEFDGRYLDARVSFLVQYQFHRGQPGFEVVTPFRPEGGDRLVLLSRGWIPAPDNGEPPAVPEPGNGPESGEPWQLVARLHVPELPPERGRVTDAEWPLQVPRLHVRQAGELLGEPVYPYVFRLTEGAPGRLEAHWSEPDFGRRMHYGYAVQWFLFTVGVLLAAVLLSSNLLDLLRSRGAR